jgi:uncharacterized membrane protein required for colicin V production
MENFDFVNLLKTLNGVVMRFGLIDITLILLIFIGMLRGYRKGFSILFNNLIQLLFIMTVTLEYSESIVGFFSIKSLILSFLARILVFFVLVSVCYYFSKLLLQGAAKILTINFTDVIDKIGGALLGGAYFVLLLSFFTYFSLIFPGTWVKETYEKSNLSGPTLIRLSSDVHQTVRQLIPDQIKASVPPTGPRAPEGKALA